MILTLREILEHEDAVKYVPPVERTGYRGASGGGEVAV
jgi:hypothetical protein